MHLGIGGNIVETAALIGIANCLYLIDRVLQQLNVTEGYRGDLTRIGHVDHKGF